MNDYEETRRRRQKRQASETVHKMRMVFMDCTDCSYYWAQQICTDQTPESTCPKCGGKAVET